MAKTRPETQPADQTIEQLQARYRDLHTKQIQADTNLKNATDQLNKLKEEARQKFGTDDVAELRRKLESMKAANEEKRKNYQAELDRIEKDLAGVEKAFASAESPESGTGEDA
jgi:chromosome segregation ATPase